MVVVLAALASSCGGGSEVEVAPGTLRLVVIGERGAAGGYEREISQGTEVAVDEINNSGGIDGVLRIRLLLGEPDGRSYLRVARTALRDGVRILVLPCGEAGSDIAALVGRSNALALAPCAEEGAALPPHVYGVGVAPSADELRRSPSPGSELDEFYERYKAMFGRRPQSSVAALGYDAVKVLTAAVEAAGSPSPAEVAAEFASGLELEGALGTIRYEDGLRRPKVELRGVGR